MSSAFVREGEEQWLHEIPPTINALINYLTQENNGIRVYEYERHNGNDGKDIFVMSNGLSYAIDSDGRWMTV